MAIYSYRQRAITLIQFNKLEAEVKILTQLDKRSPIEKAEISALRSIVAEMRSDIEDFDLRLIKNKVWHR